MKGALTSAVGMGQQPQPQVVVVSQKAKSDLWTIFIGIMIIIVIFFMLKWFIGDVLFGWLPFSILPIALVFHYGWLNPHNYYENKEVK